MDALAIVVALNVIKVRRTGIVAGEKLVMLSDHPKAELVPRFDAGDFSQTCRPMLAADDAALTERTPPSLDRPVSIAVLSMRRADF